MTSATKLSLVDKTPEDPRKSRLKEVSPSKSYVVSGAGVQPLEDVRALQNRRLEAKMQAKVRL